MTDIHGGNIYNKNIHLDFSSNINPLGMPESVKSAFISSVDSCEKYPDHNCTELKKAISLHEKCSKNQICVGNGAADLIYRIVHAFKPKKCILASPTFSEYEKALCETDCEISFYNLDEHRNFDFQSNLADMICDDTDMIFLTSPNNPTGRIISSEVLRITAERCLQKGCILVADECFMDFVKNSSEHSIKRFMNENIIILKAFTKIYAMAGLRLGYAIFGDTEKAYKVTENGQFWSVSSVAQICGTAALEETDFVRKTAELITAERIFLEAELERLGFTVYHGYANFILFKTDKSIFDCLAENGILIRKCGNYRGLSNEFYRIAVRKHDDNIKLINAMEKCLWLNQ